MTAVVFDVVRVLQGKLEGCTVNSHDVILNHTTYYLNPDAHIFTKVALPSLKCHPDKLPQTFTLGCALVE